jgi:hypothetical protein
MLNVIDHFSKYAFSFLINNKEAVTIRTIFEQVFANYRPKKMLSDNGTEFKNTIINEYLKSLDIVQLHGRHPQTQDQLRY